MAPENFETLAARFEVLLSRLEHLPTEDHAELRELRTRMDEARKLLDDTRKVLFDTGDNTFFSRMRLIEEKLTKLIEHCSRCTALDEVRKLREEVRQWMDDHRGKVQTLTDTVTDLDKVQKADIKAKVENTKGRQEVLRNITVVLLGALLLWLAAKFGVWVLQDLKAAVQAS